MTATTLNLSQLIATPGIYCDKFEGAGRRVPNLSQLIATPGISCDKFEGAGGI